MTGKSLSIQTKKISFAENKVKIIAYCGLMAAIIAVATGFLKIPTAIGYYHVGDGFIFLSAALLGPYGAIAAAIGSALADLMAGYLVYIPATFVIKGVMGLIAAYGIKNNKSIGRCILIFLISEIFMVGGYFAFESVLYGVPTAAGVLVSKTVQGILGIVIGTVAVKLLAGKIKLF